MSLTSAEDISITSVQGAVRLEAGVTMDTVMLPHGGVQGYQVRSGGYYRVDQEKNCHNSSVIHQKGKETVKN